MRPLFALPVHFLVPDIMLAREYRSLDKLQLLQFGLHVRSLPGAQVLELIALGQQYRQVSESDLSAYVLAKHLGVILLTGDKALRKLAETTNVTCHGTLWLLDEIVRREIAAAEEAATALQSMLTGGSRLPVDECQRRLAIWRR